MTKYATYDCSSIMYPGVRTVTTACNYEVECHDQSDESRCSDDISRDIMIITTLGVALLYLGIKYSRKLHRLFGGNCKEAKKPALQEVTDELVESVLNRFENYYNDSDALREVNTFLFFLIFSQSKEKRIQTCIKFYDRLAKIHPNDESQIFLYMHHKLDPLNVEYIVESKYPGFQEKSIQWIEEICGEKFITKIQDKTTISGCLGSMLFTIKCVLSIELKYIDLFKDIFLTVYIMIVSGGPLAVITYSTNFTSVIVMVMVASIILPSLLSSIHLLINNFRICYNFIGRKNVDMKQKIATILLVILFSAINPILLR